MYEGKIKLVKERADIIKVAEYFGIQLNYNNKARCVFHKEKTGSLSVSKSKQVWKCFGCGKGGDVINLVEELLKVNAYEASKQINNIFNLGVDFGKTTTSLELNKFQQKQKAKEQFKKWENKTFQLLCDYLHSLNEIEFMQEEAKIQYYIDMFIYGTNEDKLWFYKEPSCRKKVKEIEQQLGR